MGKAFFEGVLVMVLLTAAALLEVGGDAGMRAGLQGKAAGFALGTLSLVGYGLVVNLPKWEFGRLMGVYIALFFVVSQIMAGVVFHERLKPPVLVGGAFIVVGGLILTLWQTR